MSSRRHDSAAELFEMDSEPKAASLINRHSKMAKGVIVDYACCRDWRVDIALHLDRYQPLVARVTSGYIAYLAQ